MRLALALALALALLLAVAAPARAATIRTIPQTCDRAGCSGGYSVTVRLAEPYCRCRGYEISATFRQGPERSTIARRLPAIR